MRYSQENKKECALAHSRTEARLPRQPSTPAPSAHPRSAFFFHRTHFPMKETKDPALSGANAQLQCRIFFAICYFDPALFYQHFLNFCDIKRMKILIRIPGIHGLLIQKCRFLHGLCEQLTAHERHPTFFKNGCAIYK